MLGGLVMLGVGGMEGGWRPSPGLHTGRDPSRWEASQLAVGFQGETHRLPSPPSPALCSAFAP